MLGERKRFLALALLPPAVRLQRTACQQVVAAHLVMAHIAVSHMAMAYTVVAYKVMAYVVPVISLMDCRRRLARY